MLILGGVSVYVGCHTKDVALELCICNFVFFSNFIWDEDKESSYTYFLTGDSVRL